MKLMQAGSRAVPLWVRAWARGASTARRLERSSVASVGQQHSRQYADSTSHSVSEPQWWYKTDSVVRNMAAHVEAGRRMDTNTITLNTARPVTPDLLQEVLFHLYRKVEALRVCFRERDGQLWVADMDTPKIDFQVVEGGHIEDVAKITSHCAYNTAEGPLWRTRLMVCPPDEPCRLPQLKETFPHQYHLIIDMHHAVFDGLCNMVFSQILFKALDNMLDGVQLDYSQIGEFRGRSEMKAAEARIRDSLEKDPKKLKELLGQRRKILTRVPLITEAFGDPIGSPHGTIILPPEIFSNKVLEMFSAKCKAHKVTFNSGFIGVMRVALMELVREAGIVRDSYQISTRHPVDTRRYMSDVTSMVWGFHSIQMSLDMATPWDARNNFWKHVIEIDTKFRERIRNLGPVEDFILDTMLQKTLPERGNETIYDMLFTNMWSPNIKTIGNGKHVQMSDFQVYTCLDGLDWKMSCGIFALKSWVQLQMGYSTEYITNKNAVKLLEKMITVFNDAAKSMD